MRDYLIAQNREERPDKSLPFEIRISRDDDEITIGQFNYNILVMEDSYDSSWQISGEEGDLIIFDLVTYGYGEEISWSDLQKRVDDIKLWAMQPSRNLEVQISISANYW